MRNEGRKFYLFMLISHVLPSEPKISSEIAILFGYELKILVKTRCNNLRTLKRYFVHNGFLI